MNRKRHSFKVGDKIKRFDGLMATVERINPDCNNVYGKDFNRNNIPSSRPNGSEIKNPADWTLVESANDASDTLSLEYNTADLHIYSQEQCGQYHGKTALHEVIIASGAGRATRVVEEKAANLPTGTAYRAVVRFWDGDVIEYTFTVESPDHPKNIVKFNNE